MASALWYYFWDAADWPQVEGDRFELELAGEGNGWTDVTADVLLDFSLDYGINGAGPTDLVASPGSFRFALNNSEENSVGKIGYYSPQHANVRPGFKLGIGFRYYYRVPGSNDEYRKFIGRIVDIDPAPNKWGPRRTECTAADWIFEATLVQPTGVQAQLDKRPDQVLDVLLDTMDRQPTNRSFAVSDSVLPYALVGRSAGGSYLTEIQRICQSEPTRCYIRGGLNAWGTLFLEKRTTRLTPQPVATFLGTMQEVKGGESTSTIRNTARVVVHPLRVGSSDTDTLYEKPGSNAIKIDAGQTVTIRARWADPANPDAQASATDIQSPEAGTDYSANTAADGSGSDVTANLTLDAVLGSSEGFFTFSNVGAVTAWLRVLKARGRLLLNYDPLTAEAVDEDSVRLIGESAVTLDMPYQDDLAIGQAVADYFRDIFTTPGVAEGEITVIARNNDEFLDLLALEPGDPIAISEDVTAILGTYYIQRVSMRSEEGGLKRTFRFLCQRALVQAYWQLGVAGFSELGVSTVLAPL